MNSIAELSHSLIPTLWAVWIIGWLAAAWNVKRTQWREPRRSEVYNRVPVLLGMAILLAPGRLPLPMNERLVPAGPEPAFFGTLFVMAGLLFAGWARWHLLRNWSGTVTVKEDHTLIRSGPYRLVRHPIYSGMLLALFGTALAIGSARGFIGAGLILFGFLLKLRVEEARMRETFPADYDEYSRRTARLIPGVF
jgi:protein-S-isoprenylcysteine O-methyltransferase Ste14